MATQTNRLVAVPSGASLVVHEDRNPGVPLDLDWVSSVRVNRSGASTTAPGWTPRRAR